jgi:hypothetical protein
MKISNALYPSPNLRYDPAARDVVFERLNPDTGDVIFQVPSRETLKEEEHAVPSAAVRHPTPPAHVQATPPPVAQPGAVRTTAAPPPGRSGGPSISILV